MNHGTGSVQKVPEKYMPIVCRMPCQPSEYHLHYGGQMASMQNAMLQHYMKDNQERRLEFCEWATNKYDRDTNFSSGILFTEEANFYINGEVKCQNLHYWSDTNPH
jgi:hypothetical protein